MSLASSPACRLITPITASKNAGVRKIGPMTRIATQLPPGLIRYRQTAEFTRQNVPEALLRAHNTKAGVWGLIRVLCGRVRYCLDCGSRDSVLVAEGGTAVIEPEVLHHVELLDADSAFHVKFYRVAP